MNREEWERIKKIDLSKPKFMHVSKYNDQRTKGMTYKKKRDAGSTKTGKVI